VQSGLAPPSGEEDSSQPSTSFMPSRTCVSLAIHHALDMTDVLRGPQRNRGSATSWWVGIPGEGTISPHAAQNTTPVNKRSSDEESQRDRTHPQRDRAGRTSPSGCRATADAAACSASASGSRRADRARPDPASPPRRR